MWRVWFIFSCSYYAGAAATSQVVDFATRDLAEDAIKVAKVDSKPNETNYIRIVRLYT